MRVLAVGSVCAAVDSGGGTLGVFSPHIPCEISDANYLEICMLSPQGGLSIAFGRFSVILIHFQSVSISFSQF